MLLIADNDLFQLEIGALKIANGKGPIRVLHVDDDPSLLEISKKLLMDIDGSFAIDHACCVDEAFEKLATGNYDIVISDYDLPQKDGLQFLKELREQGIFIPFILFTGKGREEVAIKALNLGADGYYDKQGSPETVYGELAHGTRLHVERKKAQRKLEEAQSLLQKVLNFNPNGIYIYDLVEHRYDYANLKIVDFLGYTPEQVKAMGSELFVRTLHPDDVQTVAIHHARFANAPDNATFDVEYRMKHSSGEWRWLRNRDTLFTRTKEGTGKQILGSCEDITASRENELRYRLLADNVRDVIWTMDLEGHFTYVSPSVLHLRGYTPEEVMGQSMVEALTPDSAQIVLEVMQGFMQTGTVPPIYFEIEQPRKDGSTVLTEVNFTVLCDKDGPPKSILGVSRDITRRKKAEEKIKFQAYLLNHVGQAIIMVDNDRTIRFWNKAAEELHGWSEKQALGRKVTELLSNISQEEAEEVSKRLKAGESWSTEVLAKNRDGSAVPIILNRTPIFKEDGEFIGTASITTDISLQKNTEEDLTFSLISLSNSLDKIQELNEKLRVVGSLTMHDIRNKLSIVTGYAYILKKKYSDKADIVNGLGKMEQAVKDSMNIIAIAKIYEQIGLEELIYIDVEKNLNEAIALSSVLLPTIFNECHGLKVLADSFLSQMFYNFIEDTKKYGKKATMIRVYFEKAASGELRLIYMDDGVGISAENKLRIFAKGFSTGSSTGFGLFLIKKMVEVYGWEIQEIGEPGKGVKFIITIPKINKNGKEVFQIG